MPRALVLVCLLGGLLLQPADARGRDAERNPEAARQEQRDARQQRELRQQERAAERAERAARSAQARNGGGRVLAVARDNGGHRVRLLKDGEVRTLQVPDEE